MAIFPRSEERLIVERAPTDMSPCRDDLEIVAVGSICNSYLLKSLLSFQVIDIQLLRIFVADSSSAMPLSASAVVAGYTQ